MISLQNVYDNPERYNLLYDLMAERDGDATINISHHGMPSKEGHARFVDAQPYEAWYFIKDGEEVVGSIYLSFANEIGVFIFKRHQRKGYARRAIKMLIGTHPAGRYLANINPRNMKSQKLFTDLGFDLVQETYELRCP